MHRGNTRFFARFVTKQYHDSPTSEGKPARFPGFSQNDFFLLRTDTVSYTGQMQFSNEISAVVFFRIFLQFAWLKVSGPYASRIFFLTVLLLPACEIVTVN